MNNIDGGAAINNNNNNGNNSSKTSVVLGTASALSDATAALPTQFVLSMKTLFDILDDQQTGFVKFSDIEKGWQDERCIEVLRKVTPASGLLSFERFCGGLKLCLLKNQREAVSGAQLGAACRSSSGGGGGGAKPVGSTHKALNYYGSVKASGKAPIKLAARPPSAPMLDVEQSTLLPSSMWGGGGAVAAAVGGSAMVASKSMPQLSPDSEGSEGGGVVGVYHTPPPPPKPPRAAATAAIKLQATNSTSASNVALLKSAALPPPLPPTSSSSSSKAEIRNALQNWQMNILLSEMDVSGKTRHKATTTAAAAAVATSTATAYLPAQYPYRRGCADGGSSSATESAGSGNHHHHHHHHATVPPTPARKSNAKRRDSRRHTLQNGIDYNVMMRRLRQLEEEREMLLIALNAVERARDCYVQQVAHVQEKIKYLGLMGHVEQWSEEAQQERLNFQRARIVEVNRCLAALAETCYPMHLNLAISGESSKSNGSSAAANAFILPTSSQSTKICDADVVY